MSMFTTFPWVYGNFGCFKQLPLNFHLILSSAWSINGLRLLLDVTGGLLVLPDSPLDSHDKTYNVLALCLKYLFIGWNTK